MKKKQQLHLPSNSKILNFKSFRLSSVLYSQVCVGPIWKLQRQVFSRCGSFGFIEYTEQLGNLPSPTYYNKKNYNMIYHVIIGGLIDVYIVVRVVWF